MDKKFRPTAAAAATHNPMFPEVVNDRKSAQPAPPSTNEERAFDALAEEFFSQDSLYPCEIDVYAESQFPRPRRKRAMRAALVLLAVSSVTVVAFLAYMRLIMPVPAELGTDSGLPPLALPLAEATETSQTTGAAPASRLWDAPPSAADAPAAEAVVQEPSAPPTAADDQAQVQTAHDTLAEPALTEPATLARKAPHAARAFSSTRALHRALPITGPARRDAARSGHAASLRPNR